MKSDFITTPVLLLHRESVVLYYLFYRYVVSFGNTEFKLVRGGEAREGPELSPRTLLSALLTTRSVRTLHSNFYFYFYFFRFFLLFV